MSLFDRISLMPLIKRHLETFYDSAYFILHKKKRIPYEDKIIFLVFPALFSSLMVSLGLFITGEYLTIILTCLSLFAGLLFGLLSIVFQLTKNLKDNLEFLVKNPIKDDILSKKLEIEIFKYQISKELFVNIGFAILTSIITIITAIFTTLKLGIAHKIFADKFFFCILKTTYLVVFNFLVYFFTLLFILTLFMIPKRFYLLFESETKD